MKGVLDEKKALLRSQNQKPSLGLDEAPHLIWLENCQAEARGIQASGPAHHCPLKAFYHLEGDWGRSEESGFSGMKQV